MPCLSFGLRFIRGNNDNYCTTFHSVYEKNVILIPNNINIEIIASKIVPRAKFCLGHSHFQNVEVMRYQNFDGFQMLIKW